MTDRFDRFGEGFESFGNGSSQDNLDLAALQFFEDLDRQAGKDPFPAPRPEPRTEAPARPDLDPDEDIMPDLADSGMDSVILSLMADPVKKTPPPRRRTQPLGRPVPRKKAAEAAEAPAPAEKEAPAPEKPETAAALSELALRAARLFDRLPTQDQLLALTLLEKLDKAAER